ncbi:UNVERIFIED_CONTAM: hypothetical protein Sangu_1926800, partial [Sesamum angustifolium]
TRKSYQAESYLLNAMLNFTLITMALLSDGALPTIRSLLDCLWHLDQAKRAKPGEMKCNVWVYCPSETGCYSPDIYKHKNQECWLKY